MPTDRPSRNVTEVLASYAAAREAALGRPITTHRDVLDLLVALKGHDAFWNDMSGALPVDALPVDLAAVRASLPASPFAPERTVEACLADVGLDGTDIDAILDVEPERQAINDRIASAFQADEPEAIARSLESLLTESPVQLIREKLGGLPGIARGLALVFGVSAIAGMAFGSLAACYKGVTPEA